MMDLGALICLRGKPLCSACPLAPACLAHQSGRQRDYPSPRPRRDIPVRSCFVVVLQDPSGQVYLEKRPPVGIWGGLYSFPEFATQEDASLWVAERANCRSPLTALPTRRHSFSHFHLDYTALLGRVERCDRVSDEGQSIWISPREAGGLPAPIKTLLTELVTLNPDDKGENAPLPTTPST